MPVALVDTDTLSEVTDILIAATALTHNLILVTENPDHFSRVTGLRIESLRKLPEQ